ncbi:MAG: hypothetical protein R3C99_06575 [Pirellulaceae bacterium]
MFSFNSDTTINLAKAIEPLTQTAIFGTTCGDIFAKREARATPILVTPVARRTFQDGKAVTTLTPYAEATLAVASEEETVVIDLHRASLALYEELGDAASADFSPSVSDRTHFSRKGARAMAKLVAEELAKQTSPLTKHLTK